MTLLKNCTEWKEKNFDHACLYPFADGRVWGRLSETHPDQHNLFSDVSTWSWPVAPTGDMTCRYHLRLSQVDWLKKMMAVTLTFGHIVLVGHVGNRKYSAHFMRPRASDRALAVASFLCQNVTDWTNRAFSETPLHCFFDIHHKQRPMGLNAMAMDTDNYINKMF